jgi:two-component sensor histidine kinase/PAS domain-containing protein
LAWFTEGADGEEAGVAGGEGAGGELEHEEMDMIPQPRTSLTDDRDAVTGDSPWKPAHVEANAAETVARGIVDTIREPLLVLDRGLRLVAASRAFCSTFRLHMADIVGTPLYELEGGEWNIPQLRLLLEQILPERGVMEDYEIEHDFRVLGRRTMLLNAREVFYEGASPANIFLSIEDVTSKRRLEHQSAELFRQKDTLLDEVYHRVANSLQIIASIISMKARKVVSDEARRALEDAHSRIMSIAAVQQHLHKSAVSGSVAAIPYLTSLCEAISHSMVSDDQPISIEVRGEGNLGSQKAESVGLIVAELVINSLKHAFGASMKAGRIVVTFDAVDTEWALAVSDNGKGKQTCASTGSGLGTGIVAALARQLNALVVTESSPEGTSVSVAHRAASST